MNKAQSSAIKILYIGDVFPFFTTTFEHQLYLFLKGFYKNNIRVLPSYNIKYLGSLFKLLRSCDLVILNYEYVKFNLFPFSTFLIDFLILYFKNLSKKVIMFFHGPSIYRITDVCRTYHLHRLNIISLLYIYINTRIVEKLISKICDIIVVFTPHDKRKLNRAFLLPHGIPYVKPIVRHCVPPSKNSKRIIYYGSVTPRKPLHLFINYIIFFLKHSWEIYILSTLNRRHKHYLSKIIRKIPPQLYEKIKYISLPVGNLEIREKYLSDAIVLIPHCLDITPVYTFFEALAFTRKIMILKLDFCDSEYINFLLNFLIKGLTFSIRDLARIIYLLTSKLILPQSKY